MSKPLPPVRVSLPVPPKITSLSLPPLITSSPFEPQRISLPASPLISMALVKMKLVLVKSTISLPSPALITSRLAILAIESIP